MRKKIALSEIIFEDTTYKAGYRQADEELIKSVMRFGLLFDPVLLESGKGYIIISGFNRLNIMKTKGFSDVYATVWSDFSPDGYEKEIMKKMYLRTLGPVGRIHALRIYAGYADVQELNMKTYRERLGIPEDIEGLVDRFGNHGSILSFIDRKDTNYRSLISLGRFDQVFLDFMNDCLSIRDFRFSIFREIIDIYDDIIRNREMHTAALKLMAESDVASPDELILKNFREIRFPLSEAYTDEISEMIIRFKKHGISLIIPTNSEGKEAVLSVVCRRKDGGKGFLDAVEHLNRTDPEEIIRYL